MGGRDLYPESFGRHFAPPRAISRQAAEGLLPLAYIPASFRDTSTQVFDPVYMTKLYDLGYQLAMEGYPWQKTPPRMLGKLRLPKG